jgi:hypothetical protein
MKLVMITELQLSSKRRRINKSSCQEYDIPTSECFLLSPDGKEHNQTDQVLMIKDGTGAGCETEHYLVAAEVSDRLSVSK